MSREDTTHLNAMRVVCVVALIILIYASFTSYRNCRRQGLVPVRGTIWIECVRGK